MDTGFQIQRSSGAGTLTPLAPFVHPTALIEAGVELGPGTAVWDNVHIRHSTVIGEQCLIGEKSHISYGVRIGDRVKVNAFVYICTGVTIDDGVMISAGTIFTNDRYPRAATPDLSELRTSAPDEHTETTLVRAGATIGAGAIIGCGLTIGRFAMIGMGSVVTRSIPDFHLVFGNPARSRGFVCRCGEPFARFADNESPALEGVVCRVCNSCYSAQDGAVTEIGPS